LGIMGVMKNRQVVRIVGGDMPFVFLFCVLDDIECCVMTLLRNYLVSFMHSSLSVS